MALLQAAIDEVNSCTRSFGSHDVVRHQQEVPAHEEMVLSSDKMALLQAAIDEVNSCTRSFGSHDVVRHQQEVPAHEEMVLSSDEEESENEDSSLLEFVDTVQPFQDEMVSSDEESENDSTS